MDITYDEYKQVIQNEIKGANIIINAANADEDAKNMVESIIKNEYILKDETGNYTLNDTLIKLKLFNYRIGIYNQLLLNILRVISQKYGHNL